MPKKKKRRGGGLMLRPLWIIASHRNNWMEVLTIEPDDDGSFLAIFSFEEEAQTFLGLLEEDEKKKMKWSIRQTAPGELVSVLLAPCAHAKGVALDPLPPLPFARVMLPLVRVKRELFVRYLLEERKKAVRRGSGGLGTTAADGAQLTHYLLNEMSGEAV
jgi:hypothetical protein